MYVKQYSTAFNLHDPVWKMPNWVPPGGTPPDSNGGSGKNTLLPGLCGIPEDLQTDGLYNFVWWFVAKGKNGNTYTRKWNGCCWEGPVIECNCAGGQPCDSPLSVTNPGGSGSLYGGYQPY